MLRDKDQVRSHILTYFGGFKFPETFEVSEIPRLWVAQKMDVRSKVQPILDKDGFIGFFPVCPEVLLDTEDKKVRKKSHHGKKDIEMW